MLKRRCRKADSVGWRLLSTNLSDHLRAAVKTATLDRRSTMPCAVQVTYAYVTRAVEATVSVELLHDQGG